METRLSTWIDEASINPSSIEAENPDSGTFSYPSTRFTGLSFELLNVLILEDPCRTLD